MKNLIRRSIILIIGMISIACQIYSQNQISGRILQEDADGKEIPLEFANVVLSTSDSVFVKGTTSDLNGSFQIKNVPTGNYFITTSFIGYAPQIITLNNLSQSIDLGNIFMNEQDNELQNVVVIGSNVTNKADRLIVFVNDRLKSTSSNGINLLTGMQLPRLIVNPVTNDIAIPGEGKIVLNINGVNATQSDVKALQPSEILRVEYLDNPGLRYGDANVVINYVLKRAVSGGLISIDLGNSITTGFSDDQITAKINYKKSEFGLNYSLRYRKPSKIWNDEERIFHFDDGSSMIRLSDGLSAKFKERYHNIALNYNLLDEKYYFNATLRQSILADDKMRHNLQYTPLNKSDVADVQQGSVSQQYLPSLDLYYSRSLGKKQTFIINVVGTYINSDLSQKYQYKKENEFLDIISDVEGKKYSVIGEGIYEKIFENSNRISLGIKYMQAFANNTYTGTKNNQTDMNQNDTYIYAEYAGKKNKLSYIGGIGLSYSYAKQRGAENYSYFTFRPKLTLQYDFSDKMFARVKGEVYNTSPSLSNLSAVDQYIDTLQIIRGNPSLSPNVNYLTDFTIGWKKGIYGVNLYSSYLYSPNVIMEDIVRENGKFIQTYNNQVDWKKLNSELTLSAGPIKDVLMISFTGGINHYISNGNSYSHKHTNLFCRAQIIGMYKKFMGVFQINSAYDNFTGETLYGGENSHLFMISYRGSNFNAGVGILQPFSDKYTRYTENKNDYRSYKSTAFVNDFSKMVLFKFAWNFNFGRKTESGSKRINHSDTDAGIVKTNN